jgi:5'-nucleotidase / UDP-sugar diphosphatase
MAILTRRETLRFGLAGGAAALAPGGNAVAQTGLRLSVVHTNDVYKISEEKGRGGLARYASVVKAERAKGGPVFVSHAGDTLSPSLLSGFDQGAHMVALYNAIGLDAFAPGNHEFDFGKDVYQKRMAEARFPVLAANLRGPDGQRLPGHRDTMMLAAGEVKIGVVGATLETTPQISSPGDLVFTPAFEAVRAGARSLREEGADFVIALVHTGKADDDAMMDARMADLILTGHDHDLRVQYFGKVALAESGEDAQFIVVIEIAFDLQLEGNRRTLNWRPQFRLIDSASVTPDPEIAAMVKGYEDELSKELDVAVATLAAPLDSRTSLVRSQEAAIGNLIADALRLSLDAEIGLMNGGGIRGNRAYPAGSPWSRRDVLTELPFGNKSVVTTITGAALRAALENGYSGLPQPAGRFAQISGLRVVVDRAKPPGQRVLSVKVGEQSLDDTRRYRVATNDFLLRGGDGYASLAGAAKAGIDSGDALLANTVMAYARRLARLDLQPDGRISLV